MHFSALSAVNQLPHVETAIRRSTLLSTEEFGQWNENISFSFVLNHKDTKTQRREGI
jgi:hypothetical protein